ncbi:outer membrane protein assembly factor BamB family protein [Thermoflexus hugenholtzii]
MPAWPGLLDISGVIFLAGIDKSGRLHPVGELPLKLTAIPRLALPSPHTIVVARNQPDVPPELEQPTTPLWVVRADRLEEALTRIAAAASARWGDLPDYRAELERHTELVGREWLWPRINRWIAESAWAERRPRMLLLVAGPGWGKSALIAARLRQNPFIAFHFLRRGMGDWDDPEFMIRALEAQVRIRWGLPRRPEEDAFSTAERFRRLLEAAARKAREAGTILELWIDGLNEAFGPGGRAEGRPVLTWIPAELPRGAVLIMTSRPGIPRELQDPSIAELMDLEREDLPQQEDIRVYLEQINRQRALGLSSSLLAHLAAAAEGCFLAAVLYLRDRPALRDELRRWERDPSQIPRGLDGWFHAQWARMEASAARRNLPTALLRWGMGLIALIRSPLSVNDLEELIHEALTILERDPDQRRRIPRTLSAEALNSLAHHLWDIVQIGADLFEGIQLAPSQSLRFFHTRFPEFLREHLPVGEARALHRLLGLGALAYSRLPPNSQAAAYVRDHGLYHLIEAREAEKAYALALDPGYLQSRLQSGRSTALMELIDDLEKGAQAFSTELGEDLQALRRFLWRRMNRLMTEPAMVGAELWNEGQRDLSQRGRELIQARGFPRPGLRRITGPPNLNLKGHRGPVLCLAFAPGGKILISGGEDGMLGGWETQSGSCLWLGEGHEGPVRQVALSPDGRRIASGSEDSTVRLWDARTGRCLWVGEGHRSRVWSVAFSPDGRRIASASSDQTVRIWEAESGRCLHVGEGHGGWVMRIAFSPDGRHLVSGARDRTVRLWETMPLQTRWEGNEHADEVWAVDFLPDGESVISGSWDGTVRRWEVKTGRCLWIGEHPGGVWTIAVDPHGRYVASGGWNGTVRLWELRTGRLLWTETTPGEIRALVFSPDGSRLASGSQDGTITIWAAETGRRLWAEKDPSGRIWALAFPTDGERLASGSAGGVIRMWALRGGSLLWTIGDIFERATCIDFAPDGARAVCGTESGSLLLYQLETGQQIWGAPVHSKPVRAVRFSPHGGQIAAGGEEGLIGVWDADAGQPLWLHPAHQGRISALAFSPNGQLLASGSLDRTIQCREVRTGNLRWQAAHEGNVWDIAFSPDGSRLASVGGDGALRVWEASSGHELWTRRMWDKLRCVAFSPTGRWIACTGGILTGTVRLWEADTGRLIWEAQTRPGSDVIFLSFSPDEQELISGDEDGHLDLWETATGHRRWTCPAHPRALSALAFSPDGRWIASGGLDGTVRVWSRDRGEKIGTSWFDAPVRSLAWHHHTLRIGTEDLRWWIYELVP